MVARTAVLALALFLAAFGLVARHDSMRCRDAGSVFLRVELGRGDRPDAQTLRRFADSCRGSYLLAVGASVLVSHGQPDGALTLAGEAVRREPGNFEGWLALSRAKHALGHGAAAARALRRAQLLNPLVGQSSG